MVFSAFNVTPHNFYKILYFVLTLKTCYDKV